MRLVIDRSIDLILRSLAIVSIIKAAITFIKLCLVWWLGILQFHSSETILAIIYKIIEDYL